MSTHKKRLALFGLIFFSFVAGMGVMGFNFAPRLAVDTWIPLLIGCILSVITLVIEIDKEMKRE